ncbi:hypothetical protein BGW38_002554, partial [Lunasporangiospora selenospora]
MVVNVAIVGVGLVGSEFIAQVLATQSKKIAVLDCTSNESVANYYPNWLQAGFHVVTPNKKAFSGDLSLYKKIKEIANNKPGSPLVYHESTVGAGLPVINTLNDLVNTGDKIVKIEGIFSGTLSYIFNNFSTLDPAAKPVKFSEVVSVAKDLGYT